MVLKMNPEVIIGYIAFVEFVDLIWVIKRTVGGVMKLSRASLLAARET